MKKSIVVKKRNASAKKVTPLTEVQNKLIVDHIPYAKNVAKSFIGGVFKRGITLEQLETEACSALCEAALRFDQEKGADFKTYAFDWCKKFILAISATGVTASMRTSRMCRTRFLRMTRRCRNSSA